MALSAAGAQLQLRCNRRACSSDTCCRYRHLEFELPSAFCIGRASMPASDTVIRDLYAQLKGFQVRECELDLHLSQEISTALAHFGPSMLALDGADPLDGDFIALYYQLALRRIGQFKQRISERTSYLNSSKAVQDTLRLMGVRTALQCDLGAALDHGNAWKKEALAQQISMALLHLMVCSNSLKHQLIELTSALEVWMNAKETKSAQEVSISSHDSRKPTWRITTLDATQPVSKATYSYIH